MQRFLRLRDFDWPLLGLVAVLSVISVLEIYSATMRTKFVGFEMKQILWLAGGTGAMMVLSFVDYHRLIDVIHWVYGFCLVSLIAVLAVGQKVLGARRWIRVGGVHFQPSEWVKLILIIAVARYFANLGAKDLTWKEIFKAFALVGVPMLLVLKQPDLGTSLTYFPVLLCGLFLGGIRWKQAALIVLVGLLAIVPVWHKGLKPYQKARLTSFMSPENDPRGSGYQIQQSKIAVGDGGIWGRGATKGTQTQGDFLPIPYTDFIFAAFCEEHGFVGAVFVLLLYFLILMRLIQNAQTAADISGTLLVMGCSSHLPDSGQRGHGRRSDAGHRNPFTADELWGFFRSLHLSCPGNRDECTNEPVRELGFRVVLQSRSALRTKSYKTYIIRPGRSPGRAGSRMSALRRVTTPPYWMAEVVTNSVRTMFPRSLVSLTFRFDSFHKSSLRPFLADFMSFRKKAPVAASSNSALVLSGIPGTGRLLF